MMDPDRSGHLTTESEIIKRPSASELVMAKLKAVNTLVMERDTLKAENTQLREALKLLVQENDPWQRPVPDYEPDVCRYCYEDEPRHEDDCPWPKAQALLETKEAADA